MSLILASASPRRAELLRNANVAFIVEPAHLREEPLPNERPLDYAQRLACDKARAVFARHPADAVLGADTVVVVDEHLLEKPRDERDAARMLNLLSGRTHQVITGICLWLRDLSRSEPRLRKSASALFRKLRLLNTSTPVSLSTRLVHMPSRVSPHAGWSA